jgi:hypothetical protein
MTEDKINALRQKDANLRDALRLDEMERPQMPADLNARLMQRMAAPSPSPRIRKIWPWLAAACVAAFIVVLVAPPKADPTGEPQAMAKVEQPATEEPQPREPQAAAPSETTTPTADKAPAKSPRQLHKAVAPQPVTSQPVDAEPLLAQTPAPAETFVTVQTDNHQMTTLTERDIPITRPENYQYTAEELALMKRQANEAYLKWVELELEISKCNLEQTAQKGD